MFALTTHSGVNAKFDTFNRAADCAVKHVMQRKESVQIRRHFSGTLLADFMLMKDGTVSVMGIMDGEPLVTAWAD